MKTINVFDHITLDGFYAGPNGEIDWFKSIKKDPALDKYLHGQSQGGSSLMMGRTTYEMMKGYWPTQEAIKSDPAMAEVMDHSPKIVFSKTLKKVDEGQRRLHDPRQRQHRPAARQPRPDRRLSAPRRTHRVRCRQAALQRRAED